MSGATEVNRQLDSTDRHLLALLQANARESAAGLGRKLGIARTTVVARIDRLERDGFIAGYGLRLGTALIPGEQSILAYCGLSVQAKAGQHVVNAVARLPEVEELSAVSGPIDYMAILRCPSHERLNRLLDEIGAIDGVNQTTTSIVLSRRIDRRSGVSPV